MRKEKPARPHVETGLMVAKHYVLSTATSIHNRILQEQKHMAGPENQSATKHGGSGAIRRITTGEPFIGVALDQQHAVEKRLEAEGLEAIVQTNAIRAQTCLELYWTAVQAAADAGDLVKLDSYAARWGWLCGVAGRAWGEVKADRKGKGGRLSEVLAGYAKMHTQDTPQEGTGSPTSAQEAQDEPISE